MITEMTYNRTIFYYVALWLIKGSRKFKITYTEINILVYYLVIPIFWALLLDYKLGIFSFTPFVLGIWCTVGILFKNNFEKFCDIFFKLSQVFLFSFKKLGWNYIKVSVIICVVIPILFTILLFLL